MKTELNMWTKKKFDDNQISIWKYLKHDDDD